MPDILSHQFVWYAILCSFIIAGIHAYLGFHIVSRGVIFVDLSLAQMAAMGAASAPLLGIHEGSIWQYVVSLAFTFVGAFIVSIGRVRDDRVPQEAFIGILYAASAAFTIVLLSHQPGGMEELQHLLAGSILTVQPTEIIVLAITYTIVGLLHVFFRSRFFLITTDRQAAVDQGMKVAGWDFLFYSTFAIVVTSAVRIAGVLLVFSLLVIPPVVALFYTQKPSQRLALGWIIAALGSAAGIVVSLGLDLPAGPSIIIALVTILVIVSVVNLFRGKERI